MLSCLNIHLYIYNRQGHILFSHASKQWILTNQQKLER